MSNFYPAFLAIIVLVSCELTPKKKTISEEVTIGSQIWMKENLRVETFQNGDLIPEAKTAEEWKAAFEQKKPVWCFSGNNSVDHEKLYNWYAITDSRGLAPQGWHIPTQLEWSKMLSEYNSEGIHFMDTTSWALQCGTNESGFCAKPVNYRLPDGSIFVDAGREEAQWWSSTVTVAEILPIDSKTLEYTGPPIKENSAWAISLSSNKRDYCVSVQTPLSLSYGLSVRCIRD